MKMFACPLCTTATSFVPLPNQPAQTDEEQLRKSRRSGASASASSSRPAAVVTTGAGCFLQCGYCQWSSLGLGITGTKEEINQGANPDAQRSKLRVLPLVLTRDGLGGWGCLDFTPPVTAVAGLEDTLAAQ